VAAIERCLDALPPADELVLNWSYPLHTLLKDSSVRADHVAERLRKREGDGQIPIGYSGAYHILLSAEELKREIQWTEKNPWSEDLKTLFGSSLDTIFPLGVDLIREPLRRTYRGGPKLLIADRTGTAVFIGNGESFQSIPALSTSRFENRHLSRALLRYYRRAAYKSVVVLLDGLALSSERTESIMKSFIDLRVTKPKFKAVRLTEVIRELSGDRRECESIRYRLEMIPTDPVSRKYRLSAARAKRGRHRGTDDLTIRRFERLTVVDPVEDKAAVNNDEPRAKERTVVADMSGEVTLNESRLRVRFLQGRMIGILIGQYEILSGLPASSRFVRGERLLEFSTVSAFSFEDDRDRGLRVVQRLDGDDLATPGRIITDYYFRDGREELFISITASYPEFKSADDIDIYSLLELPLFSVGSEETIEVKGEYPDGVQYSLTLRPDPAPILLCGVSFRFVSGPRVFRLSFESRHGAPPEILPVRFKTKGADHHLWINPCGSYTKSPAASFAGMQEQFHLSINADKVAENDGNRKAASDEWAPGT
jgi:hypothetical protein